jgi:hypothetical protein
MPSPKQNTADAQFHAAPPGFATMNGTLMAAIAKQITAPITVFSFAASAA